MMQSLRFTEFDFSSVSGNKDLIVKFDERKKSLCDDFILEDNPNSIESLAGLKITKTEFNDREYAEKYIANLSDGVKLPIAVRLRTSKVDVWLIGGWCLDS